MRIVVTSGTGTGPTALAAFDAALLAAGVANYNLIPLSSIIPPGSTIENAEHAMPEEEYGHRLYVVLSQGEATQPGQEAWAGLGWTQAPDGRGLFVEHHGSNQARVVEDMRSSLRSMMENRRDYVDCPIHHRLAGARCEVQPVAAVAIAVYESRGW